MVEPIPLGGGRRTFPDDGRARTLEAVGALPSATVMLIRTHRPER